MKFFLFPCILLAGLLATASLAAEDADLLAGKWSLQKVNDEGRKVTQTIEIKSDKFLFQLIGDDGQIEFAVQGDFKIDKRGPFKTARFFHIKAEPPSSDLSDLDDEYESAYMLAGDTWTLASNFDKDRQQKPALDVYQRMKSLAAKTLVIDEAHNPDEQRLSRQPEHVRFATQDGGLIYGDLYGDGRRGIVLAHGGRFNKESWEKQARELAKAGFRVLAIDFRGYGQSKGPGQTDIFTAPLHLDVLAAVRYLRKAGAQTIYAAGGSMGGAAVADASVECEPGEIDRVVMIGSTAGDKGAKKMKGRKLFITCRDDLGPSDIPRLPKIREHYEQAPEPKELIVLECSAHAQFIFATEQGERLMREILRFLSAP